MFLPPNTTSKLQPLDLGIIKTHYRQFFLQRVVFKIDAANNASEVVSSVNVLMAIRWVALAWGEVKETTIIKCFKNAGIPNDVVEVTSEDPFQDVDERMSLSSLISTAMGSLDLYSVEEYVQGDNLEICADFDSEHWEDNFMDSMTGQDATAEETSDSEELDTFPPSPKLKNFREALTSLEDVQIFL